MKPKEVEILAIGGYGKLIANMTALIYDKSIIIIDAGKGLQIPDGWSYVTPNGLSKMNPTFAKMTLLDKYLKEGYVIKAIIITHPHGDHLAGLQQFFKYLKSMGVSKSQIPIYGSNFTFELAKRTVIGWNSCDSITLLEHENYPIEPKVAQFTSFFLAHSSYHSTALNFLIKGKRILFLPDHKVEYQSLLGPNQFYIDEQLKKLINEDLDLLILESTHLSAYKEAIQPPEAAVGSTIKNLIARQSYQSDNIFCSTYSTNPQRLKAIIDGGFNTNRQVVILGRGMWNGFQAAVASGILSDEKYKKVTKIEDFSALSKQKNKFLILLTGHMGESNAALVKVLKGQIPYTWSRKDVVILASSTIPKEGPILCRTYLQGLLLSKRIRYYTGENTPGIHCSGHIGYHDYVRYVNLAKSCKKVILNHGDIESSLLIYPLLESQKLSADKYVVLKIGEKDYI